MLMWRDAAYGEVVAAEYLSDLDTFIRVHTVLAEYFIGRWAGDTSKPYELPEGLATQFGVHAKGEAVRHVPAQPLVYPKTSPQGVIIDGHRLNLHKLLELATHLSAGCMWDELTTLCLCNFEFLKYKIMALVAFEEVLADFENLPPRIEEPLRPIKVSLAEAREALEMHPAQVTAQVAARVLPPLGAPPGVKGYISAFLEAARLRGTLVDMSLMPRSACLPSAVGLPLGDLRRHEHAVYGLGAARKATIYATGSDDKSFKIWQVDRKDPLQFVAGHHDWLRAVALTSDGAKAIVGGYDATLGIYDLATGELLNSLSGHFSYINDVAISMDNKLAISSSEDGQSIVWDLQHGKTLSSLTGHEGPIYSVAFIDDRRAVTASADGKARGARMIQCTG
jgi:WD40 repeat protein